MTETKMDQIGSNLQWLYDNMPRANYNAFNVNQRTGVKILAGLAVMPPDRDGATGKTVYFGDVFSVGCRPVVTTGLVTDSARRIHVTLDGIGTVYPDHRGFQVHAYADAYSTKNNKFTKTWYVAWHAIGY